MAPLHWPTLTTVLTSVNIFVIIGSMNPEAILISIPEALARTGIGRSFLYERLADGSVRSVKAGRRRLVDAASLQAWAAALPEEGLKHADRKPHAR